MDDGVLFLYGLKSISQIVLPFKYHPQYANVTQHRYDYGAPHRASPGEILVVAAVLIVYSAIAKSNVRPLLIEGVVNIRMVIRVRGYVWVRDR